MEIIIGKTAGFCYGVKRAVKISQNHAKKEKLYCLGEIVHNKNVVRNLENLGIKFIDNIEDADSTTIIRAHGEPKEVYKKANDKKLKIIDLTCPGVLKIHGIVNKFAKKGYYIIITGKEEHPEVIGIRSYAGEKHKVIRSVEELKENLNKILCEKKILLVSQTTFNLKKFTEISEILKNSKTINNSLVIHNTICSSTENRQKETRKIAEYVNAMIIVGGKNSSNSTELYKIASGVCDNTQFVANAEELDLSKFRKNSKIGIMAGASTPKEDIYKIKKLLLTSDKIKNN